MNIRKSLVVIVALVLSAAFLTACGTKDVVYLARLDKSGLTVSESTHF